MPTSNDCELTATQSEHLAAASQIQYRKHCHEVFRHADWIFAWLMLVQWSAGIAAALLISPQTWIGASSTIHLHVWASILLGGAICLIPALLVYLEPGAPINRYVIAIAQTLYSSLLIHLMGGRIEAHFHVFGALAFLSLYRNWKVLAPATAVVALDHMVRGILWPESVFGVETVESWRWMEHAGWVIFEVSILTFACVQAQREMKQMAAQWARLSLQKEIVASEVDRQTEEVVKAGEMFRESEARLRSVISSANDAFVATDGDDYIMDWSQRAEELFGWTPKEAIGGLLSSLIGTPRLSQFIKDSQEDIGAAVRRARKECVARHRSGAEIPIEISVASLRSDHQLIFNAFIHNSTNRMAMQSRLLHAEKMEGIGQLAAGIAHEINTPTQFASDNLCFIETAFQDIEQLLKQCDEIRSTEIPSSDQSPWEKYVDMSQTIDLPYLLAEIPLAISQSKDGVRRIAEITAAMKAFSHPGSTEKTPVDLTKAIHDTATVCRNEWKHVAELVFDLDPELTSVPAYPGELNQVVLNLIVNAANAIGASKSEPPASQGRITITTKRDDKWVIIQVQDNGSGMPEAIKRRIFEPFFTTKPVGKGTGQGLAIAHSVIVDKHQGEIEADSELGKGTTFTIRLPLSTPTPVKGQHAREEANLVCG